MIGMIQKNKLNMLLKVNMIGILKNSMKMNCVDKKKKCKQQNYLKNKKLRN